MGKTNLFKSQSKQRSFWDGSTNIKGEFMSRLTKTSVFIMRLISLIKKG